MFIDHSHSLAAKINMGVSSLHPQVIRLNKQMKFLCTTDQQSVIHSSIRSQIWNGSTVFLLMKMVINPSYLTQVVLFLQNVQLVELLWTLMKDQITDTAWGPVTCYASSSYFCFLPSKTMAQVVKENTLHPGSNLNLLHPKYAAWR